MSKITSWILFVLVSLFLSACGTDVIDEALNQEGSVAETPGDDSEEESTESRDTGSDEDVASGNANDGDSSEGETDISDGASSDGSQGGLVEEPSEGSDTAEADTDESSDQQDQQDQQDLQDPVDPVDPLDQPADPVASSISVAGCTDTEADNFKNVALYDDGACAYSKNVSCTSVDHLFSVGDTRLNGSPGAQDVQPGDVIGVQAGVHNRIRFENLTGTEQDPITIINCDGVAVAGSASTNNAIQFTESRYVRLTGTGDAMEEYGIQVAGSASGTQGVLVAGFSSNFEIDHLDITGAGFAGIMAKTDPSCNADASAERGEDRFGPRDFTMYDLKIHDNFIHDVDGEAIYVGNSFYNGTDVYTADRCGGFIQYPHEVRGVDVYGNLVERTGWDGIQVGASVEGVNIHNNVVREFGLVERSSHDNGIQVGAGTTGAVFNNVIDDSTGTGIIVLGIGDSSIYNNVIRNVDSRGIAMAVRRTPLATDVVGQDFLGNVEVVHNTIISTGSQIREFIVGPEGNFLHNNLIVEGDEDWNQLRRDTDWDVDSNSYESNISGVGFVDSVRGDFQLGENSPALDRGSDPSAFGIQYDANGFPRVSGSSADLGAYELQQ